MSNTENIISLIRKIWSEELLSDKFSSEDDFFELGGNSLKLISILDKLQKSEELKNMNELTIIELFDHPTINELTVLIESKLPAADSNA